VFGAGGDETLRLETPGQFTSVISGFSTGDIIELPSLDATSLSYSKGTLTLFDARQNVVGTLTFAGKYSKSDFALQPYGKGGSEVVFAGSENTATPPPDFLAENAISPRTFATLDTGMPETHGAAVHTDAARFDMLLPWHGHIAPVG
jgi:hypothetical protein